MTSPSSSGLSGLRVLVVEDEAILAMLLEDILADLGCKVVGSAGDVKGALAVVTSVDFDVAILDTKLHGADIEPVAAEVKARGRPFILATGYSAGEMAQRFGDCPVVEKPFDASAVQAALLAVTGS